MLIITVLSKNIKKKGQRETEIQLGVDITSILKTNMTEIEIDHDVEVVQENTLLLVIRPIGMTSMVDVRDTKEIAVENSPVARILKVEAGLTKQDPECNYDLTLFRNLRTLQVLIPV